MPKPILTLFFIALQFSFAAAGVGTKIGDTAPEFTLPDIPKENKTTLSGFRGQVVVMQMWKTD